MNCNEDEPRKVPKPMTFSQKSLHPAVPEVSLILQQATQNLSKNESFSDTEFSTYNAWRWKNFNGKEENSHTIMNFLKERTNIPIHDKFSGSDIERRKNEILYGNPGEPRQPMPPRSIPVIFKCPITPFSDVSFNSEQWTVNNTKSNINLSHETGFNVTGLLNKSSSIELKKREHESIGDVYKVIAEQNRQMVLLQKQIEQLLKSQENKDKQIEQLLKSQDSKENKIEQLLKMQVLKENHIQQLLIAQEKSEKHINQLIKSQELWEKHKHKFLNPIRDSNKEMTNVGIMAKIDSAEKSTNTSFPYLCDSNRNAESHEDLSSQQIAVEETRAGTQEKSFTLCSLNLPSFEEPLPTPQSSIHVDIPEYNGSSDEESCISSFGNEERNLKCNSDSKAHIGYTFYNNILSQVKGIIQDNENENEIGSPNYVAEGKSNTRKYSCPKEKNFQMLTHPALARDSVKQILDVNSYTGRDTESPATSRHAKDEFNPELQQKMDCSVYKDGRSPSDISLKINSLALKYLKKDQISQYDQLQLQQTCRQPDVTIYNVTNLSFGTMRYLERYKMSSSEIGRKNMDVLSPHHFLQQKAKAALGNEAIYNKTVKNID